MVRYLSLITYTSKGIEAIQNSPQRAANFKSRVSAAGGKVTAMYWSLGNVDGCVIFEAPDEQTATKLLLELASEGNVRTQTSRVFDDKEFKTLVRSPKAD